MPTVCDAMGKSANGNRPLLELAAESIADVSGVAETVVDVLHARAFGHYAEGLRQYLAFRLGDVESASTVLAELRALAAAKGAPELVKPPGIRARLYRLARDVCAERGGRDAAPRPPLPYRRPTLGLTEPYRLALGRVRSELPELDAEVLELRHARELSPEEIAHVMGTSAEETAERLAEALGRARAMLADVVSTQGTGDLSAALLEAFALEQGAEGQEEAGDESRGVAIGTIIGDRYKVRDRVGSGSFADVYRADDTEVPGHVVAIKLLHQPSLSEESRQTALRELHLIASVFHPSIVQFKDHGWHENRLWFVMPWYQGDSLEDRIDREPLSRAEARTVFEPLARALATMHAAGIRHQDIKPDNIFLARLKGFGQGDQSDVLPVLLDLGVAAKEAEMVVAGTPTYFAPEVASQFSTGGMQRPITAKADVFSLALSLRNALEPHTQEDVAAGAVESFIEYRAETPPDPPSGRELRFLRGTFGRWLSTDPDARPSAEELADELAVLTRPEDVAERRKRVLRWLLPLLLALGVTFGSVVYVLNEQARIERQDAAQARYETANALADLNEETGRREALEEDVAEAQQRYRDSALSRQELATRLGSAEGDLEATRGRLTRIMRRARQLQQQLVAAEQEGLRLTEELHRSQSTLASTRGELADARSDITRIEGRLTAVIAQLSEASANAERAADRVDELTASVNTLRGQHTAERARADELDQRLTRAEAERSRTGADLARAEQEIERLERQVERLRARRPAPGPGQPEPETTGNEPAPTEGPPESGSSP